MSDNFDFENLDAYKRAEEFGLISRKLLEALPKGHARVADQLERASLSIPLNIAEGAGEFSPGDKTRFFRIARRSATECGAILNLIRSQRLLDEPQLLAEGRDLLIRIVQMLTRLTKKNSSELGG